ICLNGGRNSDGPKVAKFLVGIIVTEVYKERNGISLLDCFKSQCLMKIKGRWEANKAAIKAMLNILVLWYFN
uniref:Uncharacterized protein n=1 Tax=Globisporangium ultimum (strain ATCC 200006 / CBS 805.95 / DAOM BR144) TaxID=431595 RepID=K3XCS8_GLOUD